MDAYIGAVIQGGAFIVVAFVVYHMFTKHIPELTRTFTEALAKQEAGGRVVIQDFIAEVRLMREAFSGQLLQEREYRRDDASKIVRALDKQNALIVYLAGQLTPLSDEKRKELLGAMER